MPRRPTSERETPNLDRWLAQLEARLAQDGARPDLVSTLAQGRTELFPRWQTFLWKILNRKAIPDGENLLAISAWLHSPPSSRPKRSGVERARGASGRSKPGRTAKRTA